MTDNSTICPSLCSQAAFARLIGVSPRRVSQLVSEGVVVFEGDKILAQESLSRYVSRLQESADARAGAGGLNLTEERARLTVVQRQTQEQRLKADMAEVISLKDAQEGWAALCGRSRRFLEVELPRDLRAALKGRLTTADDKAMLDVIADGQRRVAEELENERIPGSNGPEDLLPIEEC